MKNYTYQNSLIGKKQLRQLLAWSFTNYDSMQACALADELKYLGFKYASQAGISISIEDLKINRLDNKIVMSLSYEEVFYVDFGNGYDFDIWYFSFNPVVERPL